MKNEPITNCEPCRSFVASHPWDGARHVGTSVASPIRCAFGKTGKWQPQNWNCRGIEPLREAAEKHEVWNNDQHCATIRSLALGVFIVLSYYKHRGQTEGAWLVNGDEMRPLRLSDLAEHTPTAEQSTGE